MFDLANNRLSYSELLRPDAEYTLDYAVGMTYSLDLEALLGVPVSLGLLDQADPENLHNPLYVLEAIRRSSDHITLFCNAGCIHLPKEIRPVFSLLENSVYQVKLSQNRNFHPKIWVIKYSQDGQNPYIKVLIMSRNLTFDNSIDIAVAMQGVIGTEENPRHKPLSDLLRFVLEYAGRRKQNVLSLADDVLKVSFFGVIHPFGTDEKEKDKSKGYDFFPIGIPEYNGDNFPLFGQKYDLFCVSPFLSDNTVQKMTQFKGKRCLVTRKDSVTPAVLEAFGENNIYVIKDILNDNEYGVQQDIHAKMYYVSTRECNYLYLGSANASFNAFNRNVEFLLRLRYKPYCMGYLTFYSDFIPNVKDCPYEQFKGLPEKEINEDTKQKKREEALREAVYAVRQAVVSPKEDLYTIRIESKKLKTDQQISIAPLQCSGLKRAFSEHVEFTGITLKQLSEFYVLSIEDQGLIVKIKTNGIPKDRDQAIYRSIIDTNNKFMRYLSFALTDELPEEITDPENTYITQMGTGLLSTKAKSNYAVYEQMLRVFHQNPEKMKGIADMIKRLDPKVVGDDFLKLFKLFEDTAKKVRRA